MLLVEDGHGGERHFAPPGGLVEPGETPREAAVREVAEECGIAATITDLLGVYVARVDDFAVFAFLATVEADAVLSADRTEVFNASWFETEHLPKPRRSISVAVLTDAIEGLRGVYREV